MLNGDWLPCDVHNCTSNAKYCQNCTVNYSPPVWALFPYRTPNLRHTRRTSSSPNLWNGRHLPWPLPSWTSGSNRCIKWTGNTSRTGRQAAFTLYSPGFRQADMGPGRGRKLTIGTELNQSATMSIVPICHFPFVTLHRLLLFN